MSKRFKGILQAAVFVAFTAYSIWVVGQSGYVGFIDLALREPWGMQILLDLVIACFLLLPYAFRDLKARGIPRWPLVLGTIALGTIPLLGYVAWRNLSGSAATRDRASAVA